MMDSCSVGIALETTCHKKLYQYQKQTIISLDELNHEEQELLRIRITAECEKDTETSLTTICTFHKNKFLDNYSHFTRPAVIYFMSTRSPFAINLFAKLLIIGTYKPNVMMII